MTIIHVCSFRYLATELEEITNGQIINQFLKLAIKCPINYHHSPLKLHNRGIEFLIQITFEP